MSSRGSTSAAAAASSPIRRAHPKGWSPHVHCFLPAASRVLVSPLPQSLSSAFVKQAVPRPCQPPLAALTSKHTLSA